MKSAVVMSGGNDTGPTGDSDNSALHRVTSAASRGSGSRKRQRQKPAAMVKHQTPPAPPTGWEARFSGKRQKWYYLNKTTHVTRWVTDEELATGNALGKPRGWTAMLSKSKHKWYIVNLQSGGGDVSKMDRRWIGSDESSARAAAAESEAKRLGALGATVDLTDDDTAVADSTTISQN